MSPNVFHLKQMKLHFTVSFICHNALREGKSRILVFRSGSGLPSRAPTKTAPVAPTETLQLCHSF